MPRVICPTTQVIRLYRSQCSNSTVLPPHLISAESELLGDGPRSTLPVDAQLAPCCG
jgi:hypothetical protein